MRYLTQIKFKGTPQCPRCYSTKLYWINTRSYFKCSKCRRQFSPTRNTIFYCSNIPLRDWFEGMRFFLQQGGAASNDLKNQLCIQQKTVHRMLTKIRYAIGKEFDKKFLMGTVESDETFVGPDTNKDLRKTKSTTKFMQKIFFGMLQRKMLDANDNVILQSQLMLRLLGNHKSCINSDNILPILNKHVHKGAELMTDGHSVYNVVKTKFKWHYVIAHTSKVKRIKKDGTISEVCRKLYYRKQRIWKNIFREIHTNGIENNWKHLKRMICGTYIQFSYEHAQGYADEYAFRFNHKHETLLETFNELLLLCCRAQITCDRLKKHIRVKIPVHPYSDEFITRQFSIDDYESLFGT